MIPRLPRAGQVAAYERQALIYLLNLPLEYFMEAMPQATQREITLESLALVKARRPDLHVFNELLVQYPMRGRHETEKVVPDNMVVLRSEPIQAENSYNVSLEPARPFWVLEYVFKGNPRKEYLGSFRKYEHGLKVPYCLLFCPDAGVLTLYHHNHQEYVTVRPNQQGRYAIPELELEMAILDGWVRFWYRGELLLLPAELQNKLDVALRQLVEAKRRADDEKQRADDLQQRLAAMERELAALRAKR